MVLSSVLDLTLKLSLLCGDTVPESPKVEHPSGHFSKKRLLTLCSNCSLRCVSLWVLHSLSSFLSASVSFVRLCSREGTGGSLSVQLYIPWCKPKGAEGPCSGRTDIASENLQLKAHGAHMHVKWSAHRGTHLKESQLLHKLSNLFSHGFLPPQALCARIWASGQAG